MRHEHVSGENNWIHVDVKGAMSDVLTFEGWLMFFVDCGFNGIVLEYDDRLPWQTWPDTFHPGFDLEAWQRVWRRCEALRLEVVPLIQAQGHLEWLLKRPQYRSMREADQITEVCPLHPDVLPRMRAWIDEVIAIHPDLHYIHLGADETWHLATCPRCRSVAQGSEDGKLKVYLDHVGALCEHAIARGVRPILWADMFWREERFDLTTRLPTDTVLVDWQYDGAGPWPTTSALKAGGHAVWGGSAVRSGYHMSQTLGPLQARVDNVLGWHARRAQDEVSGLIHTTWGRSSSLRPIYGPWEGWLPAFVAAGDPTRWPGHPLREWVSVVDRGMLATDIQEVIDCEAKLARINLDDSLQRSAVDWWRLALEHRRLFLRTLNISSHFRVIERTSAHVGIATNMLDRFADYRAETRRDLDRWDASARTYLRGRGVMHADTDEFVDARGGVLRDELAADDAAEAKLRDRAT